MFRKDSLQLPDKGSRYKTASLPVDKRLQGRRGLQFPGQLQPGRWVLWDQWDQLHLVAPPDRLARLALGAPSRPEPPEIPEDLADPGAPVGPVARRHPEESQS